MRELVFGVFEVVGTVSFAISGAMAGIRKGTDLFGVLFLGILTAVGGGVLRDILLGSSPPLAFTNGRYVTLAAVACLLLFWVVRRHQDEYRRQQARVDSVNNIFDAIGLGTFTISGVQLARAAGHGGNLFFLVFLGLATGTGGGMIRDLTIGEIPFVLKKRIYAVASILGALCNCGLETLGLAETWAAGLGILTVFFVRMLATRYKWNLPRALKESDDPQ